MKYMLWNKDEGKWFKETYDTITEARKAAYGKRCCETYVCAVKENNADVVGIVMNKKHNMYGKTIYISYTDSPTKYLNSDGTLGERVD